MPHLLEIRTVLLVEGQDSVRRATARTLERAGFSCLEAPTLPAALDVLHRRRVDGVVCDLQLPRQACLDFVRWLADTRPETGIVVVDHEENVQAARLAIEAGAHAVLSRPVAQRTLIVALAAAVHHARVRATELGRHVELDERLERQAAQLRSLTMRLVRSQRSLRESETAIIRRVAGFLEFRRRESGAHLDRVAAVSYLLARRLGLPLERAERIRVASLLHDVGMIAIPDAVLAKPGRVTDEERALIQKHTELGHRLLSGSGDAMMETAAVIAYTHHERLDGSGYPRGLVGDEVPIEGRIVAVADVFDALTSDRPHRPALSVRDAVDSMCGAHAAQFDPAILDVLTCALRGGSEREQLQALMAATDRAYDDAVEAVAAEWEREVALLHGGDPWRPADSQPLAGAG